MGDPPGEADRGALRLDFDRRLILQFRGSATTSAGLLAYRELHDTLGLTNAGADTLANLRTGKNGRHQLVGLRQSVFGRLAGYEEVHDAERLRRDPAMRWVVGERAITNSAASASQMGRFEARSRLGNLPIFPASRSPRCTDGDREADCARHGFEREPDLWRAVRHRSKWSRWRCRDRYSPTSSR